MSPVPVQIPDNILRGTAYGLTAYFMFGVMQACGKILSESHSVVEIAFYRNLIALVPFAAFILARRRYDILKTRRPRLLVFRVLIGATGLMVTFGAFKYLPMADATVILFSGILMTPVIAFFVLNERMGPHRWAAIILGLCGVMLMVRPTGEGAMLGIAIAFLAAFSHAIINVTLRLLRQESSLTVTFYFIFGGVLLQGALMPFFATVPHMNEIGLFLAVGISGAFGQYALTSAFRAAPAGFVAPLNYTGLVWATLFDIALWGYVPGWSVYAGGAVILAANAYIIHRERLHEKRAAQIAI